MLGASTSIRVCAGSISPLHSAMAAAKIRYQVLLDQHRASLFEEIAEQEGLRTTALLRKCLYTYLEDAVGKQVYDAAVEKDAEVRRKWVEQKSKPRPKP